ncbi:protein kinase domain-containing protein [Streptomyces sp. NEAU-S77]|uniref:protein kinase domain-containing protein n=1 Tax=Streptomyces sp. NEAU-S77 TaxID=3411033 RepID=UPI003BA0D378
MLKEGRRHGETDWDGQDGRARVRTEAMALRELAAAGVHVPVVYEEFDEQRHACLAVEDVGERTLEELVRVERLLSVRGALLLSAGVARLVAEVHEAGWAWRDCKPRNVVVGDHGVLRRIDFEGGCSIGVRGLSPWGSEGYASPEWLDPAADQSSCDLFALGVSCYQVLVGTRSFGATSSLRERSFNLQQTADLIEENTNAFHLGLVPYDSDDASVNLARLTVKVEGLRVEQCRREQQLDQPHEGNNDPA